MKNKKLSITQPVDSRVEAEVALIKKYPKIFKQVNDPMTQTCMCWGLECGQGWYWVIDNLCGSIQSYIDLNKKDQLEATQVKEKFGGLRFYTNYYDEYLEGMIALAEWICDRTCEQCGTMENVSRNTNGWISTRCKTCRDKNV